MQITGTIGGKLRKHKSITEKSIKLEKKRAEWI